VQRAPLQEGRAGFAGAAVKTMRRSRVVFFK
jgi:hypothetical protein